MARAATMVTRVLTCPLNPKLPPMVITPELVGKFASVARERMPIAGDAYRRDHLRALAQRVEVADKEVRTMGSKGELLRTLAAGSGVGSAVRGVPSSVPNWRRGGPPS